MDARMDAAVDMIEVAIKVVLKDFTGALTSGIRVVVNGVRCVNSKRFATRRRKLENMRFFRELG